MSLLRSLANIPKAVSPNLQLNPANIDKYNRKFLKRALEQITKEGKQSAIGQFKGFGYWFPGTAISGDLATQTKFGTNALNPLRLAIKDKNADPYELALQAIRTGSFGEGTKNISSKQRQQLLSVLRQMEREKTEIIDGPEYMKYPISSEEKMKRQNKAGDLIDNIVDNYISNRDYLKYSPAISKLRKEKYPYYHTSNVVKYGDDSIIDILAKGSAQQKQIANKLRPLSNIYKANENRVQYPREIYVDSSIKPIRTAYEEIKPLGMQQFVESNMRNLIESSGNKNNWMNSLREKLLESVYRALPDSPRSRETALVLLKDENPNLFNITNDKIDEIVNMARLLEEGM